MATVYTATVECQKRAWIRDSSVPMGQPALGKINCSCGKAPLSNYNDGIDVKCECGILYDSKGWILSKPLV